MKTTTMMITLASLIFFGCGGSQPEQPAKTLPVPESIPFTVKAFTQSECKQESYTLDPAPAAGSGIKVEILGEIVKISHLDAQYNCAARVKMTATLVGAAILIQEIIENPEESAFCVCKFDLSVEVQGLQPGVYNVEITDANGLVVGQTQVTMPGAPQIVSSDTMQSECKNLVDGLGAEDSTEDSAGVSVTSNGNGLTITHWSAEYNCAAKIKMEAALVGDEILVQEILLNPEESADCNCPFDIAVEVEGLPTGSYTVKVYGADGQLAGAAQTTIGPQASFSHDPTAQSACQGGVNGSLNGPAQGLIKASSVGQGAAIITHEDAPYNCASKLLLEASLTGNEIVVTETITNPWEIANCYCIFDLSVTVRGLADGIYTVKVYTSLMQLVDEISLTIP